MGVSAGVSVQNSGLVLRPLSPLPGPEGARRGSETIPSRARQQAEEPNHAVRDLAPYAATMGARLGWDNKKTRSEIDDVLNRLSIPEPAE